MKVFILASLILATIAVRLPSGPSRFGLSDIKNSGPYSSVTFVVVPRQNEENVFHKFTPSVKTKRVIKPDDRMMSPYGIPRRKLNYRQTENVAAQFLKEVTPTTMSAFEEQQQQQFPIYRFTETPAAVPGESEVREEAEVENNEPQTTERETNEVPLVDVQNQIRPILFVQPDFNIMPFLQQAQEGVLDVQSQDTSQDNFMSLNRFLKPDVPKTSPKKNQRPQIFSPSVNEDTDETTSRPTQTRGIPVFRQTHPSHVQFEFGNRQTYNKRYLGQLPQLLRELPFRYRLQLQQYNRKQDAQPVQFPSYFDQAQTHSEISEENSDMEKEMQTEVSVRPPVNLIKRKYHPVVQEKENVTARINYQPHFFYPNYRYKLYPYTTNPYISKNKQGTVQLLKEQDEEEEQAEYDEQ